MPATDGDKPVLLKAGEAARLLGISRAYLYTLEKQARIPAPVRLGRAVRWSRDELKRWAASGAPPRDVWMEQSQ